MDCSYAVLVYVRPLIYPQILHQELFDCFILWYFVFLIRHLESVLFDFDCWHFFLCNVGVLDIYSDISFASYRSIFCRQRSQEIEDTPMFFRCFLMGFNPLSFGQTSFGTTFWFVISVFSYS